MRPRVHHQHVPHGRMAPHGPRQGWSRGGVLAGLALLLALLASGVLLWWWPAESAFERTPAQAAWRHAALVLHGAGAWGACMAMGRWVLPHVRRAWRLPSGGTWWLGLAAGLLLGVLALTGLGLLYGPADGHEAIGTVHWWAGLAWPALLLPHARRLLRWR